MPDELEWLPVAIAARRLGVSQQALRRRVRRGTIPNREERSGNRVRALVGIPAETPAAPADPEVALLRQQVSHLEGSVADLRAERDRLHALVAELVAERRPLWATIKGWARRKLGEG